MPIRFLYRLDLHGWEPQPRVEFLNAGARQGDGAETVVMGRKPWAPAGSRYSRSDTSGSLIRADRRRTRAAKVIPGGSANCLPGDEVCEKGESFAETAGRRAMEFLLLLLMVFFMSGCIKDAPELIIDEDTSTQTEIDRTLVLELPSKARTSSYAVSETVENTIAEVDLLVYKVDASGETFLYRTRANSSADLTTDGSQKTVRLLVKNTDPGEKVRFVLFANLREEIDALNLQPGHNKDDLYTNFEIPVGKWNAKSDEDFKPLPMWGETATTFEIGDNTHNFPVVRMLRALARIDIGLMFSEFFDEPVGLGDNFVLNEVHLYNMVDRAKVVPFTDSLTSAGIVKGPSMPSSFSNTLSYSYTQDEIREMKSLQRTIYVAEQPAGSVASRATAPCVVLGGTIKGKPMTFYRVDFLLNQGPVSASDPDARDIFLPLLRNYRYILNVVKVDNIGYNTPQEAFDHNPINTIQIKEVFFNEYIASLSYDGNYMLAMQEYQFKWDYTSFNARTLIYTDHPNGWDATVPEEFEDWIHIQSGDHGAYRVYETLRILVDENHEGANREGYVLITFGRLEEKLWVYQTNETPRDGNVNIAGMGSTNNGSGDFIYDYAIMNINWRNSFVGNTYLNTGVLSVPWGVPRPRPSTNGGDGNIPWMDDAIVSSLWMSLSMTFSSTAAGQYDNRKWKIEYMNPADSAWLKTRNYHWSRSDYETVYKDILEQMYISVESVKYPDYCDLQTGSRTGRLLITYDDKYSKTVTIKQDIPYFKITKGWSFTDRNNNYNPGLNYTLMLHPGNFSRVHYPTNVTSEVAITNWYHFANVPDNYNGDIALGQVSPARKYSCAWLNEQQYLGHTDWRMPTVEEADYIAAYYIWENDTMYRFFIPSGSYTSDLWLGMEEYFTYRDNFTSTPYLKNYTSASGWRCVRSAVELD